MYEVWGPNNSNLLECMKCSQSDVVHRLFEFFSSLQAEQLLGLSRWGLDCRFEWRPAAWSLLSWQLRRVPKDHQKSWIDIFSRQNHGNCQQNCSKEEQHLDGVPTKSPWNRRKSWWNLLNMHSSIVVFRNMKLQHKSNVGICFRILQGKDPWVFSQFQGSISTIPFPTWSPSLESWKVPNRWVFSPKKIGWEPDLTFRKNKANLPAAVFFSF